MITQDVDLIQGLIQGSTEWHSFRKNHIDSSDAPIIMNVSPYSTPYQLWCRKLGLIPEPEMTGAMQRGHDLEPLALAEFERQMGLFMSPTVRVSSAIPWMSASLDGLDLNEEIAVEIKCPNSKTHQMAIEGKIPDKYIYQLQHQMLVLNVEFMYYFSFDGREGVSLKINRDERLQEALFLCESRFWSSIQNFEPPELNDRDYIQKTDANWASMANEWKRVRTEIKELEQKEESYRNALIHMANKQNAQGAGIRLQAVPRKGVVDYSKVPELKGIDLEPYRKETTQTFRLSEVK